MLRGVAKTCENFAKKIPVPFWLGVGIVAPEEKTKDFFEIEGFPGLRDQLVYITVSVYIYIRLG